MNTPASTNAIFRAQRKLAPYVFISPFYVLFTVFMIGPLFYAAYTSFTNWQGLEPPKFIAFRNYAELFQDKAFKLALVNNLWYSAVSVFLVIPMALILALLLNAAWMRGKDFFRTVYFMPIVTSAVVVGIIFSLLYSTSKGLLNWVLGQVGILGPDWLGTREWVKPAVTGLIIWRWTGNHMIYFLAGLQGVPQELHEAAMVDGADGWKRFLHITLPMLRPVILFVVVITTIGSFQIFEEPYMLTGGSGGPGDAGLSLTMYLYRSGFTFMKMGFGSAVGFVLFAIIFVLSLAQTRLLGLFRED